MRDKKEIIESVKLKISISNFQKEENIEMIKHKNIFKSIAVACCMIISLSSIVFAKEISIKIYENFFLTGNGMETAINEGYIENATMDYQNSNVNIENEETGEIIEDADTQIKVDEFVMDDFNLSMTFDVTLSEKAQEMIKTQDIIEMNFPDLIIYDENDVVLFSLFRDSFDVFCKEHQLDYNYDTVPEDKWVNTGVNMFVSEKNENHVKVIYNIYTSGTAFPKSKKLNVYMKKIRISKNETVLGDEEIVLTGNWNFSIDVPEKMYNRKNILYKQISTTNKDFNVLTAKVYDTGTDIKLKFKARKHEKENAPTTPELEFWKSLPQDDPLKSTDILNYLEGEIRYTDEYIQYEKERLEIWKYDKYIENADGKRFEITQGPRENGGGFIDDDGIYESNVTFDLTKYEMTDTITVYVDYQGNKAEIVLEKVEE